MWKLLISVIVMSVVYNLYIPVVAGDRIFKMKSYEANLAKTGAVTIERDGNRALLLLLMTFNDKIKGKYTRMWPPYSKFYPKIKVSEQQDAVEISISYSKPGLVKSFEKRIVLMSDTILVETKFTPAKLFYSCSLTLSLFPEIFDGAQYVGLNKGKSISGKMPEGAPGKYQYTLNRLNLLSEISFTQTKVGTISFTFTNKARRGLSDLRAVSWSQKYRFRYSKNNYQVGQSFEDTFTIKFTPKNSVPKAVKVTEVKPAKVHPASEVKHGSNAQGLYSGKNFIDKNANGVYAAGERLLSGFKVTEGKNVTVTDRQGGVQTAWL